MLQDLGLVVTRLIPEKAVIGVLTGAYKVCGGVIRNMQGRIVAHLVNAADPSNSPGPLNAVLASQNSYHLQRFASIPVDFGAGLADVKNTLGTMSATLTNVAESVGSLGDQAETLRLATNGLVSLATGTMALSGLTLAVSAAGFVFLNRKLGKIDQKLNDLQKDIKEIKAFLNMRQRAELTTALNTLRDVSDAPSDETRRQLLVHSRQTLGTLHHHYRSQFSQATTKGVISASEEYFTITAIAHALCAGELDMYETAARDLEESYSFWLDLCRKIAKEKILRTDPQRFLCRRYASSVRSDELIDWMGFSHGEDKGLAWIDELRAMPGKDSWLSRALTRDEILEVDLFRRLAARNRIFQGYCSQYEYLRQRKIRPLAFQHQIDQLDRSEIVSGAFILIPDDGDATGKAA